MPAIPPTRAHSVFPSRTVLAAPTTLTLNASKTTATPNEHFNLTGYLKDANGNGVANESIHFYWRPVGQTSQNTGNPATTDNNGYHSAFGVYPSSIQLQYQAVFTGDSIYANATSNVVKVTVS